MSLTASSILYAESVGTKVVKHYTTVVIHRSSPHGVVFLAIMKGCSPKIVCLKVNFGVVVG